MRYIAQSIVQLKNLNSEFSEEDFAKSFWALWPGNLEDDVSKLQNVINNENTKRKEKHLRPIQQVTKGEFVIFNALMIGSSVFAQSGQNLWNTNKKKNIKVRSKLSTNADFGKYMKLWRFKELQAFIPKITEDCFLKEKETTGGNSNFKQIFVTIVEICIFVHHIILFLMRV